MVNRPTLKYGRRDLIMRCTSLLTSCVAYSGWHESHLCTWWRQDMETISALLFSWEGNHPVTKDRYCVVLISFMLARSWSNSRFVFVGDLRRHNIYVTTLYWVGNEKELWCPPLCYLLFMQWIIIIGEDGVCDLFCRTADCCAMSGDGPKSVHPPASLQESI